MFISESLPIVNLTPVNLKTFWSKYSRWECRVWINLSWFGKCNAFFIFHDTVFPTYPEDLDTKYGFCFLNGGIKTRFFHVVKVKNDFSIMRISFLLKQLCWCCLGLRFFSLILIRVSFCNSFQLFVLYLSVHILRIVLQLLNVVLNLCIIIINCIVAPHLEI